MKSQSHELLDLVKVKMPYGKYKGRLLCDLPEFYLAWYNSKGFPDGKLGEHTAVETRYPAVDQGDQGHSEDAVLVQGAPHPPYRLEEVGPMGVQQVVVERRAEGLGLSLQHGCHVAAGGVRIDLGQSGHPRLLARQRRQPMIAGIRRGCIQLPEDLFYARSPTTTNGRAPWQHRLTTSP